MKIQVRAFTFPIQNNEMRINRLKGAECWQMLVLQDGLILGKIFESLTSDI